MQLGIEGALQLLAGSGSVLLVAAVLWDASQREVGRRRLDPAGIMITVVLSDIIAPALSELLFLGLSATSGS